MSVLAPIFAVVIVALMIYASYLMQKRRRDAMRALAAAMKMEFVPYPGRLDKEFREFYPFDRSGHPDSRNLIQGQWKHLNWRIFDYVHKEGKAVTECGIVSVQLPISLAPMRIRPEGAFDRLSAALGFNDLNFESEEFNRRYHVSSDDRQQAYDVIHPQMIEYLLDMPDYDFQFRGDVLLLAHVGFLNVGEIQDRIRVMVGVIERVPGYVRRDRAN